MEREKQTWGKHTQHTHTAVQRPFYSAHVHLQNIRIHLNTCINARLAPQEEVGLESPGISDRSARRRLLGHERGVDTAGLRTDAAGQLHPVEVGRTRLYHYSREEAEDGVVFQGNSAQVYAHVCIQNACERSEGRAL